MLIAAVACARSGTLRVTWDSTTVPGAVEVLAAPVDPSLLIVNDPARHAADSLNADSLDQSDRRTPAYADAFAAFTRDAANAESLRIRRDTLRRHEGPVRAVNTAELKKEADAAGRELARAKIVNERASLRLRVGTWWIVTLGKRGESIGVPRKVEIIADRVDTLRISN